MRRSRVSSCLSFVLVIASACAEDPVQPDSSFDEKPLFDHTTPAAPGTLVAANNYHLLMTGNEVYDGMYKGQYVFFAGQVAYGTDAQHVFFYDTRGLTDSFVDAGLAPFVDVSGTHADHYTAAVLAEDDDQRGGPRQNLGIVTVRESFAFSSAPDDDYVILRYSLINPGGTAIVDANLGFVADPDVINATINSTSFDAALQAAVTYDPGHAVRSATILLDRSVANYHHWVNVGTLGADVRDPGDYAGWYALLSGAGDAGALQYYDVRNALTTAPVSIPSSGAVTLTVALVAGDDDADLAANVAAARARFAAMDVPIPTARAVGVSISTDDATYSAQLTFATAAQAAAFVAGDARCGQAPLRLVSTDGPVVTAAFDRLDVDPSLLDGDRVHCAGRLGDGSFFTGFDVPVLPDPRVYLTAVAVGATSDLFPTWSPDGHTLAFSSNRGGPPAIWLLDTADPTAAPTRLTAGTGGGEIKPDWSPDGRSIVFIRSNGVFEIDVASGVERQLTRTWMETGDLYYDMDVRYSPDGRQLVLWRFQSVASGRTPVGDQIWVMPRVGELAGGTATPLTSGGQNIYPDWGTDGRIYFTRFSPALPHPVFSVDPAVGAASLTQATPTEMSSNRHPALSPDGRTLAFNDSRLVLQDMTLGRHTVAILSPHVQLAQSQAQQNVEFSPDGTRIAFVAGPNDIYYGDISNLLDPAARAAGLASSVQSLIDAGLLDGSGGAMLIASLDDVAAKLEGGQIGAALNKVNAYINQVNALIRSRRVGAIEGERLIDGGQALAEQIG